MIKVTIFWEISSFGTPSYGVDFREKEVTAEQELK